MGSTHFQGLDYQAVQAGLTLAGVTLSPEAFDELRHIEMGALQALNEVKK